jgi:hypothetical protein
VLISVRCNVLEKSARAISLHLHVNMFCAGRGGYYEYITFDVDPDIKFTINSFSCFVG